ncbi:MAG: NAD(P)-dependent oxidoreductase, partial [Chloroflexota bacterium]|nr:NAD(P)-dependent oxidoreductase [Chloroflexota bacterium]
EMIEAAGNLRGIIKWGVGYENVDVSAATEHGLPIVTLPVFLASVAEAVFCFLFTITKKYQHLNALALAGKRPTIDDRGHTLEGKVLGCVGLGRIGRRVACIALAFEMKVLVYDPYLDKAEVDGRLLPLVSLDELLSQAHFVSLHAPLTAENHHMIDDGALEKMRSDAYLINVARGGLVDEAALYRALIDGQIAGAALDTFEVEPVSPDNPLLGLDNVWATPHYLGATWESLAQVAAAVQDAALKLLQGEHPGYQVVNPEVFEEREQNLDT